MMMMGHEGIERLNEEIAESKKAQEIHDNYTVRFGCIMVGRPLQTYDINDILSIKKCKLGELERIIHSDKIWNPDLLTI
jgi:hypothetical protein